jgi:hypothetical protein
MPARAEDITNAIIYDTVCAIRVTETAEDAAEILMSFCERYRKNYHTKNQRPKTQNNKEYYNRKGREWREAHREEYNAKRRVGAKREKQAKEGKG